MLGVYKTLSAMTKPTGKNKFDAGKKGKMRKAVLWKEKWNIIYD